MPDLRRRSYEKELLDRDDIPFADIRRNMEELEFINKWLGGHAISLSGLRQIINATPTKNSFIICEIGCGGGDNLKSIARWCAKHQIAVSFIGIDINPQCIAYAKINCKDLNAEWIANDYRLAEMHTPPDIIFSSLFCHHFTDEELNEQLKWLSKTATAGFFINDLHRHSIAYFSIKILTRLFSNSYLVKNDAAVSVTRGFSRHDLETYCKAAAIHDYRLSWKWAFRWLLTYVKNEERNLNIH